MTGSEKKELMKLACQVRMGVIDAVHAAKSGHPGGSLSAADMFTYLYFKEMKIDPENPQDPDRDRFVLSKGHTAPGLYSTLALRGFFPAEELLTLRKIGSRLQGHPNMNETPGVDMSTGSLGQGISAAAGMALAAKKQGKNLRVYTLLGDGEIEEGQVWEAMMFAHHYELDNLCVIIDNNDLQIDGRISDVVDPYPIVDKVKAFGLHVEEIDGHDFDLTKADLQKWVDVMDSLVPDGEPSMRQDTKAGRPTEAGLFCGTVMEIAERHGIDVPVNRMFYNRFLA